MSSPSTTDDLPQTLIRLSKMQTERTTLRSQYESLYEERMSINRQMTEIEERLQLLDEEIDRVKEEGAVGDNVHGADGCTGRAGDGIVGGGVGRKRKYATILSTQITQPNQSSTCVEFEIDRNGDRGDVVDDDGDDGNMVAHENGDGNGESVQMTLTHPEEILTDPGDDDYFDDSEHDIGGDGAGRDYYLNSSLKKARPVSTSPAFGQLNLKSEKAANSSTSGRKGEHRNGRMQQSEAPPRLKHSCVSANPARSSDEVLDLDSSIVGREGSNYITQNASCPSGFGTKSNDPVNPFQDLWLGAEHEEHQEPHHHKENLRMNNSSNQNIHCRPGSGLTLDSSSRERRSSNGVNTLEKYFVPSRSSSEDDVIAVSAASSELPAGNKQQYSLLEQPAQARRFQTNNHRGVKINNNLNSHHGSGSKSYPWTHRMLHHLHNTFRISSFRDHQEEIINTTLSGLDAFVIMRTGGGKSLTYQLPALLEMESNQRKVTVVISPLVSLIRDQKEQMNEIYPGSAVSFTSGMDGGTSEHARRWSLVRNSNAGVALIFITPEKVGKSSKFKGEMEKLHSVGRLGRFVIDECHCACQWGFDFRPDYKALGILKHHFPTVPLLAVTATASERVKNDCAKILGLAKNHRFFRSTANRPNLKYMIKCKKDKKEDVIVDMVVFIREFHEGEAGIIYTFSKKEADEVADKLCEYGIVARPYHSDVSSSLKASIHRSWMRNETQVVVATIAFGLGINKPDVRFVLHHSISKSLEAYYQESGRAGRDGNPASCVLYYSPKDVPRMLGLIHGEKGEPSFWGMVRYGQAHGDDALCRHAILMTLGEADTSAAGVEVLAKLRRECTGTLERDVGAHCQTVTKVVNKLHLFNQDVTLNQLVTKWRSKVDESQFGFLKDNPPSKDLNKEECERIIVSLLVEDVLHPKIIFTAYNTVCYIVLGPRGKMMLSSLNPSVTVSFPIRARGRSSVAASSEATPPNPLIIADGDGWISRKDLESKPIAKSAKSNGKTKAISKTKTNKKEKSKTPAKKKKEATPKSKKKNHPRLSQCNELDIVELDSSSTSEEDDDEVILPRRQAARILGAKSKTIVDSSSDSDFDLE